MIYSVNVRVMPKPNILDPQGTTVQNLLNQLNIDGISSMRVGKNFSFNIESDTYDSAVELVGNSCDKLLCNPITEVWEFSLKEV